MPGLQVHKRSASTALVASDHVARRIITLRGRQIMLDADLAELFGVATRVLNQAVRRHGRRFPSDFMFRLTATETLSLRSQIVISNRLRGGRRFLPYAFTEHGAVMLASVLNSPTAVAVSLEVVRAFVRLRSTSAAYQRLVLRLDDLEATCDKKFAAVFRAIRQLLEPGRQSLKRQIGFRPPVGPAHPWITQSRSRLRRRNTQPLARGTSR